MSILTDKITMHTSSYQNLSNPEARGQRVRYVRDKLLGLTRDEFCQHAPISHPCLKAWELAWGGGLTECGAVKFCQHVQSKGIYCSPHWLLHAIGTPATLWSNDLNIDPAQEAQIAEELLVFRNNHNSLDALVKDDTMQPFYFPGDYVAGIITSNLQHALGQACIIVDTQDNLYIRQLSQHETRYQLQGLNKNARLAKSDIDAINIQFAAPILWHRKPQHA